MTSEAAAQSAKDPFGGAPGPIGRDGGGAAGRIRFGTALLVAIVLLAGFALFNAWYDMTRRQISADLHDRLAKVILEAALPTSHELHAFDSLLEAIRNASPDELELLLQVRTSGFLEALPHDYGFVLLDGNGVREASNDAMPLPEPDWFRAQFEAMGQADVTHLGPAYQIDGAWYATLISPGPDGEGRGAAFASLTFPLDNLTEIWRNADLPPGSSLSLVTRERRLWWRYPMDEARLGDDLSGDPQLMATQAMGGDAELVEVVEPGPGAERLIVGSRRIDVFDLSMIAAVPADHVDTLWRDRHSGSVLLILAAGGLILGLIGLAGMTIAREAGKRSEIITMLEQSQQRFRSIANATSDWFWESGKDGRIVGVSDRLEEVTGIHPSFFVGKSRGEFVGDGADPASIAAYQATVDARKPFKDFVYPYRAPDGRTLWFKISGMPLFDAQGAFRGYCGAGADITESRATETRLNEVRARLARAIENNPYAFALFDDKGRLAIMNHRFADLHQASDARPIEVGDSYEEIMGNYARSGRNPRAARDPEAWLAGRRRTHGSGSVIDEQLCDGRWIRVREFRTPEQELICAYMDLTADKGREAELLRLNEENRRLAAAVDAAGVGIVITHADQPYNRISFVNPAFTRLTGYGAVEAIGRSCDMLQGPETDSEASRRMHAAMATGEPVELEILHYRKNGETFWNLISINPVLDQAGRPRYFVSILNDVTEQKRSEQDLLVIKEAAESSNRSKSEFLAIMSHELRTPLNAIIGFSDILKGEMFGPVGDDRYKEYAKDIYESGSHLLALINDILDLSKAEAGKLELHETRFALNDVVHSTIGMMRPRADHAGIRIECIAASDGLELEADERKIKQVLLNLLSNAIKFSRTGSTITVAIERLESGVALSVTDRGIGIAPDDIGKALEPFCQVDGTHSRAHEGTGLGLPLAKRLIEMHDGELTLTSELSVGTSVRFTLPETRILRQAA